MPEVLRLKVVQYKITHEAIRKEAGLFCGSIPRKGAVVADVGRNQDLTDLTDLADAGRNQNQENKVGRNQISKELKGQEKPKPEGPS